MRLLKSLLIGLFLIFFLNGCSALSLFKGKGAPKIAFVIDDVGYHGAHKKHVKRLNVPMTYAVIPFVDSTKKMSKFLNKQGAEIILHMPMASKRKSQNIEEYMLHPHLSQKQIKENIEKCMEQVPYAVGVNNHKGSAFTANYEASLSMLKVVKSKKMFFLDSLTVKGSKIEEAAKKARCKVLVRDVFLDNKKEIDYIKGQIRQAVKIALKTGEAIAIGHYHKETLIAIYESLPEIRRQGIEIVFLSELL